MELISNTLKGLRYYKWTWLEAITYFFKGAVRELKICPSFFENIYLNVVRKKFLKKIDKERVFFDIKGALLPDISIFNDKEKMITFISVFNDTFLIPVYYNDDHKFETVLKLDKIMMEGPYGYYDDKIDVTVKNGDVVIDIGAWIGDFSAYAASKGATAYAFEPVSDNYTWLCKTAELNNSKIIPVQKALGAIDAEIMISICPNNSGANSMVKKNDGEYEKVKMTTLDKYVEENKIERIDFIKADIEGSERDMLRGATEVMRIFAPKLAICTYHLPDDPEVLEAIIKEANPSYKVVQLRHKLFAAVV